MGEGEVEVEEDRRNLEARNEHEKGESLEGVKGGREREEKDQKSITFGRDKEKMWEGKS